MLDLLWLCLLVGVSFGGLRFGFCMFVSGFDALLLWCMLALLVVHGFVSIYLGLCFVWIWLVSWVGYLFTCLFRMC